MPKQTITPELEKEIRSVGASLGEMLAKSSMPDEVKQSWLALLPQMTWEQILKLFALLENDTAISGPWVVELAEKLAAIKKKYVAQREQQMQETMNELKAIVAELEHV